MKYLILLALPLLLISCENEDKHTQQRQQYQQQTQQQVEQATTITSPIIWHVKHYINPTTINEYDALDTEDSPNLRPTCLSFKDANTKKMVYLFGGAIELTSK